MDTLPDSLLKKLEEHFNSRQGKTLSFVRPKWSTTVLAHPTSYVRSIFVDPEQRRGLKAARYVFGKSQQIVFVGGRANDINEHDDCAVVTYDRTVNVPRCPENISVQQWHTWKLDRQNADKNDIVLRFCFKGSQCTNVDILSDQIATILDEWSTSIARGNDSDCDRRRYSSSSADSKLTRLQGSSDGDDHDAARSARNLRSVARIRCPSPSTEVSQPTEEKIRGVFRVSDQAWVRLCCIDCGRKDLKTVGGMMSHCLAKHNRQFQDKNEVADLCGIVLRGEDEALDTPLNIAEEDSPATPSPKASTKSLKRKRHDKSRKDPLVVFRDGLDLSKTRVRRFSCCQGIDRFFAHAQVAGTADRSTLILSVKVGEGETIQIIREDEEDFNAVMNAVKNVAADDRQQIVVTSASLFN